MIVVSDSTPLIHFAKAGHMDVLCTLYEEIVITKEVYREAVEEGILLEKEDAKVIKNYVGKRIRVKSPRSSSEQLVKKYHIHKGEADSIKLAKEINAQLILMNERNGRNAAKSEGIKVKGTVGVLFDALKAEVIEDEATISILKKFRDNPQFFWIEPDIIKAAMKKIYSRRKRIEP